MNAALKNSSEKLRKEMLEDISREGFDDFLAKYQDQVRSLIDEDSEIELESFREVAYWFDGWQSNEKNLKMRYGFGVFLILLSVLGKVYYDKDLLSIGFAIFGVSLIGMRWKKIKDCKLEVLNSIEEVLEEGAFFDK